MGPLINFLVLMVLLFAGLAQTKSVPPRVGYAVGGTLAAVTMVLAVIRYRRDSRK